MFLNGVELLTVEKVRELFERYFIGEYLYYMFYYMYQVFNDIILYEYLNELKCYQNEELIECYGLNKNERKNA